LIFKTLPDAPVHWRDVRVGAVVTAALFTAGRLALGWYLGREGGDSAHAAAASLLALLAWVYYSSQLVLFGAEFTYAYAHRYGSRAGQVNSQPPARPAGAPSAG
jgi:membrane protein